MPPIDPLYRHQILLYRGDYARLNELYATKSAAEVIRTLVRNHIRQIEQRLEKKE